jgi:AcrR family transcriptional regulator
MATNSERRILTALTGLLDDRDPSEITITGLVAEAGVTRPTFYAIFGDLPTAFARAALARMADAFAGEAVVEVAVDQRPEVMLGAIGRILGRLGQHADFYSRVVSGHGGQLVQAGAVDFLADELLTNTPVGPLLRAGRIAPETSARAVAAAVVWTVLDWLGSSGRTPVGELAVTVRDLVLYSVVGGLASATPDEDRKESS